MRVRDPLLTLAAALYRFGMKITAGLIAIAILMSAAPPARALCIYNGVDNAKTTMPEEFRDSKWVVRAKVLSAKDHWSDDENSWTTYNLEVLHAYKGHPPKHFQFFTYRDSGGFYMDRPWVDLPTGHDIGGEYLLFLNRIGDEWGGRAAPVKGAVFVNYSCGRSGPWTEVRPSSRRLLATLERAP